MLNYFDSFLKDKGERNKRWSGLSTIFTLHLRIRVESDKQVITFEQGDQAILTTFTWVVKKLDLETKIKRKKLDNALKQVLFK